MIITDSETIANFLEGSTQDYKGRTFSDIISCSDSKMEECHDQVQWMFPLHEESKFAQTYPVLTRENIQKSQQSDKIKANLRMAAGRMEKFFAIGEHKDIDKQRKWCRENNHNLLRITRIIRCLRFFGLSAEAKDFHDKVVEAGNHFGISQVTKAYWFRAMNEDVWKTLR